MYQYDKKKIILIVAICILIILTIVIILVVKNRKIDVTNATHAVVLENKVNFYKQSKLENVKIYKQLNIGTRVYILESFKSEDGTEWCKVVIDNKIRLYFK